MYEVVQEMVDKMGYEVTRLVAPLLSSLGFSKTKSFTNFFYRLGWLELPEEFMRHTSPSYTFQRFATCGLELHFSKSLSFSFPLL